jgi:YbbR domain-containing protein
MAWHPFRNIGLKIVALALGTLLWLFVSGQEVERSVAGVPVYYRNVPAPLVISGDRLDEVSVHIRGGEYVVSRLVPGDLALAIDLADAGPGTTVLSLRPDQVETPLGVEVTQVNPGSSVVTLEKSMSAEVPVRATIEGDPAPGFAVGAVTVDPRTVTVLGPAVRLQGTTTAVAERVSVEGAKANVTATVAVGVSDTELRLPTQRTVRVTVEIAPAADRSFAARPVTFRNLAAGQAAAEPAAVAVSIRGVRGVLAKIPDDMIAPYVDLAGLGPGRYNLPVGVDLRIVGADARVGSIAPATVNVIIR